MIIKISKLLNVVDELNQQLYELRKQQTILLLEEHTKENHKKLEDISVEIEILELKIQVNILF